MQKAILCTLLATLSFVGLNAQPPVRSEKSTAPVIQKKPAVPPATQERRTTEGLSQEEIEQGLYQLEEPPPKG